MFFLYSCYCTSLPLPDGWSILLQHPVPVSFKPPRPSSRDGLFPTRTSTYHWRLISFSPCPDSEDVPAWRLSRGTARAQTSFSFRGQWGGGSHEWVCVDALKMQKAFVYVSIRLFPCTGVVSSGKQQTHYSMKNICKLLYYSIYIALLYYSIYIIIFQANILWFLLLKYEDLLLFSDCKLNMFEFWTKHLKTKHLRAVEELWWTFVSIFWHLQTKRLFEEKNGISTNNENIINVQYCRL